MSMRSSESGLGTEPSSIERFFKNFMPGLEAEFGQQEFPGEDPTMDLEQPGNLDVAIHKNSSYKSSYHGRQQVTPAIPNKSRLPDTRTRDPLMEELQVIRSEFEKGSHYGNKLADIMLKGLKKTLEDDMYRMFLAGRLPASCYPIIRMNNDNTPYVEFILKSDVSDQDPDSQFSDYSMSHILVSKIIIARLLEKEQARYNDLARQKSIKSRPQSRQHQQSTLSPSHKKIRQYPERMNCSTPLKSESQSLTSSNGTSDSRRILPPRACKSNTSIYNESIRK